MKNGVLEYYANKLEREGIVKVERKPGHTRFFPPSISESDILMIKNLRQETPRQILSALLKYEILSFNGLVKHVNKSPATISLYLTQLRNDDIVENILVNLKRYHRVKDIEKLRMMINKYHSGVIERSADHLADTFSSL